MTRMEQVSKAEYDIGLLRCLLHYHEPRWGRMSVRCWRTENAPERWRLTSIPRHCERRSAALRSFTGLA